ncbi:winged helix-turn-helix transcriptional regulator [Planctomycetales bacterium ZRK34]|nr:winged helix-turn-helix transcriptional regulator [Planctomycetales bacterium ZRK34]
MPAKTKHKPIDPGVIEQAAKVLRVLAHADRIRMVELLLSGDYSVGELAEAVDLAPAAVSQHLNLMRAHGILESQRDQRQVYYRVIDPTARQMITCLRKFCV